jgi:multisubunit Na+/H+ antiporter MnhB subunit
MSDDSSIHPALRGALAAALAVLIGGVAWALASATGAGLEAQVDARLEVAGADNPVTAVLLNFRAYDTLLEIAVLTIALLTIWSLREDPQQQAPHKKRAPAGRALRRIIGVLVPLMVLVAGYLLWAGTYMPGGAFPAGAVAASAVVLVILADLEVSRIRAWLLRAGIVAGLLTFVVVGLVGVFSGLSFLEYPTGRAGPFIVIIESMGAASIALILAGIFAASARRLTRSDNEREAS